jgi:hypothetical protein
LLAVLGWVKVAVMEMVCAGCFLTLLLDLLALGSACCSTPKLQVVLYPAGPSPTKEELKSKLVAKDRHIEALQKRVQLGVNHSQNMNGVMQNLFQGVQQAAQQQQQLNQWAGPTTTSHGEFKYPACKLHVHLLAGKLCGDVSSPIHL